jgi:hypothetical protein
MILRSLFIFSIVLIGIIDGIVDVNTLARCIMSEASFGTRIEQTAIGFACLRNRNHASNQHPTPAVTQLARNILSGRANDLTKGANRWYSPLSMPNRMQRSRCKIPFGGGMMDCNGGLENACGPAGNYKPNWAKDRHQIIIPGVRSCYFKFYRF